MIIIMLSPLSFLVRHNRHGEQLRPTGKTVEWGAKNRHRAQQYHVSIFGMHVSPNFFHTLAVILIGLAYPYESQF